MNKIVTAIFTVAVLSFSFSAVASKKSDSRRVSSGVILFTGTIVVPPCVVETYTNKVKTKCWNDKGTQKTASIDIQKLQKLKGQEFSLPNLNGTQQFNWVNKDKTLGVYTINYD
ncbi:hypothetical protein [Providencia sp. Me31A]|uniref:hypothetical protein n=1 Tax=Providencia sp. Me31A TaxID=3392637 RepID=UPI003D2736B3